MADLKIMFNAIVPENIKNIPLVQTAMDIFIKNIEDNSAIAVNIQKMYELNITPLDNNLTTISKGLIKQVVELCNNKNIPTSVDPKKRNFNFYKNVSLFKPNLKELKEGLNIDFNDIHAIHGLDIVEAGIATFEIYKVSKNKDFGFMEFNKLETIKTKEKYCNIELALNKELGVAIPKDYTNYKICNTEDW